MNNELIIMIKTKEIQLIAEKIKKYVEKNKKVPNKVKINNKKYTKTECLYTLSYAINHLKEDFAIKLAIKMNALQDKTVDCRFSCILSPY